MGSSKKNKSVSKDINLPLVTKGSWGFKEAYKAARTNLNFILPGNGCKIIGITSAVPGVGKTVTSVNLAISFAQIGKKVILIDCDMRLPSISANLGIKSVPGLADVLAGEAGLSVSVQRNKELGLDVLPAGNIPSDPTWLLQSEQLKRLIAGCRKVYDYVIVDFPPILTVSDALIVSGELDGYVMIVREGISNYKGIAESLAQVDLVGGKVLGFIYNDVRSENHSRYYKSHYYKSNYYYSKGGSRWQVK